jgi:phosphoribosylformylglycinamidine (FGAM) synthase-like enzyme
VALVESAFGDEIRFGVEVDLGPAPDPATLFGEGASRVLVSCAPERATELLRRTAEADIPCRRIGAVGEPGGRFRIAGAIDAPVEELYAIWEGALPALMERPR